MTDFTPVGLAAADAFGKLKPVKTEPPKPPTHDELMAATLKWAGVPERYTEARFDNWRPTEGTKSALAAARSIANRPANLVLIGPWGCGKTRLAASIMAARVERWMDAYPREIIEQTDEGMVTRPPFSSRFYGVPQLLDAIRRSYEYDDEPDPLRPLFTAPLLILDDLGREKATDWVLERLYVLIDTRYGNHLPTVVTTNYSPAELAKRDYGAMISRLSEDARVIKITAADQRPGIAS